MADTVWLEDHIPQRTRDLCSANGVIKGGGDSWLCQYGFGNEPSVHFRTLFDIQTEHASVLHLRFVVRWESEPAAPVSTEQLDVYLHAHEVSNINVDVSNEGPPESNLSKAQRDRGNNNEGEPAPLKWWNLTVQYESARLHACNLFTDKTYGNQQPIVDALRELFRGEQMIHLRLWGLDLDAEVSNLRSAMAEEVENPPLAKWYPTLANRKQNFFVQLGQLPLKHIRPSYKFKPCIVFSSQDEYVTVMGFGAIQEDEFAKEAAETLISGLLRLRLMTIPGAGDRRYLGFLECPETVTARIQPGDVLKINFDPAVDDREQDWHAVAVPPMPFAPLFDTSLILTRPWNKDDKQWACLSEDVMFSPVDITKCRDGTAARMAVTKADCCEVKARLQLSDKPVRGQVNSLRKLTDNPGNPVWPLLLGNDMMTKEAEKVDMYSSIAEDYGSIVQAAQFNARQHEAFDLLTKLPWGFGMFQGPPGTGKTYWIMNVILPLIAYDNQSSGCRHHVLITGPANDPVTDTAISLADLVSKTLPRRNAVIVRCHTITTEDGVAWLPATKERGPSDDVRPPIIQPEDEVSSELDEMLAAMTAKEFYDSATSKPHGVADTRLRSIELSLGTWMLKFSGIFESPWAQPERFKRFVAAFRQWSGGNQFESADLAEFRAQTRELRDYVLANADVVVSTLFLAGTHALSSVLKPDVVVLDEAAKPTEPDTWNILANYQPRVHIFVGDHQQLKPVVVSDEARNNFRGQLAVSLFARLRFAGYPPVMFEEQHRMHPIISGLVSKVAYRGSLRDATSVNNDTSVTETICKLNKKLYGVEKPLLFLDVTKGHTRIGPRKSKENLVNVAVVMNLIAQLIMEKRLRPSDIVILVPYNAQSLRYLAAVTRFQEIHRDVDTRALWVRTIDSFQGNERPVTFLDLTVMDRIGFMRDGSRLNVALSRAQRASYVIGSMKSIDTLKSDGKFLQRMLSYARQQKVVVPVHDVPDCPYIDVGGDQGAFRNSTAFEGEHDQGDHGQGAGKWEPEPDANDHTTKSGVEAPAYQHDGGWACGDQAGGGQGW